MSVDPSKVIHKLLDIKIRVPPQLAQRLNSPSENEPPPPPPIKKNVEIVPSSNHMDQFLSKNKLIHVLCILSLSPFILDILPIFVTHRQQLKGCGFILLSPITFPCLLFFNLQHKNSKWSTIFMAFVSIMLGNIASLFLCSSFAISFYGIEIPLLALSLALISGTFQLLMLINKKNIAIVMISTATSVIVCGLSIAGLFLPSNASKRCYQSTIPCILWLFWQAAQNQTFFPHHNQDTVIENIVIENKDVV